MSRYRRYKCSVPDLWRIVKSFGLCLGSTGRNPRSLDLQTEKLVLTDREIGRGKRVYDLYYPEIIYCRPSIRLLKRLSFL